MWEWLKVVTVLEWVVIVWFMFIIGFIAWAMGFFHGIEKGIGGDKMVKHFKNGKLVPTELTWEEKNPTDYVYRPSEAITWLQKRVAKSADEEKTEQTEAKVK